MIRLLLIVAVFILIAGGYVVRSIEHAFNAPKPQAAAVHVEAPRAVIHSGRSMTLEAGRNGHFEVEARIAGRAIEFIVDTGATLVILRESDAALSGIRPMPVDYTATVSTANGKAKAAPATIRRMDVGGIVIHDVRALVLPDDRLGRNLLGMSFLSQLKRYQVANGRMVLEQ